MLLRRALVLSSLLAVAGLASACEDPAPRMHVTRKEVPLGVPVVVHLEDAMSAPRSGALWLTLAPADAPESFVGERLVVDPKATHATLTAPSPGRYEVRLHDDWPNRPHHLVARRSIEVVVESASATFMSK
jgi:hypothetical protein